MTNKRLEDIKSLGYAIDGASRVEGGGNNQLFLLKTSPALVAKIYHQDEKKRALHDINFSRLLFDNGLKNIAQVIDFDISKDIGVFSYLDGQKPELISDDYIQQIACFIKAMNTKQIRYLLPDDFIAAEACFCASEYLSVLTKRVEQLNHISVNCDIDQQAKAFITESLSGKLAELLNESNRGYNLPLKLRLISPSDFGLHNSLDLAGRLSFFDFEYAGWDDPCKMVADFFSHPAFDVPLTYLPEFIRLSLNDEQQVFVYENLPRIFKVIRFKWVCILLNEFLSEDSSRRIEALNCHLITRKEEQLEKAKRAFLLIEQDISEYLK